MKTRTRGTPRTLRLRSNSSFGHVNHDDVLVLQHPRKVKQKRKTKLDDEWTLVISHCNATLLFTTKQKNQLIKFLVKR